MTDKEVSEPKEVIPYDIDGKEPFTEWLEGLRDIKGGRYIVRGVLKLKQGIPRDCVLLGEGVRELRIFLALVIGFISVNIRIKI